MSILIVTQTFPPRMGGMEAVMLSLANHFSNVGYETLVVADKPYVRTGVDFDPNAGAGIWCFALPCRPVV